MEDSSDKKLITILSIDGGGVRGIIPGKILATLETELRRLDGDNAKIADYFDMIAGTSTGGLIAALLATRNETTEPRLPLAAKDLYNFYSEHCPQIFSNEEKGRCIVQRPKKKEDWLVWFGVLIGLAGVTWAWRATEDWLVGFVSIAVALVFCAWIIAAQNFFSVKENLTHPKYDGKYLRNLIKKHLGEVRLSETLTNVLIPSYDLKNLFPAIFSTLQANSEDESKNPFISDVCIATSAAPYYLPPHFFQSKPPEEYNLADGGLAANNPTLLAIGEMSRAMKGNQRFASSKRTIDMSRYLVLSLGTGAVKNKREFTDEDKKRPWGIRDWFEGPSPLQDILLSATDNMVEMYTSLLFQGSTDNYLRIQVDTLEGSEASMDNSSKENLENLKKIGEDVLEKNVSILDPYTGMRKCVDDGDTYKEALKKFAKRLSAERGQRIKK